MFLDTRRPGWPAPWFLSIRTCFVSVDSNLASPRFELTTSDVAGHPSAWLADSVFLSIRTCFVSVDSNLLCPRRFELGFAKIRINDQRCRWTPAGLVGRLRVFVDSNLASPRFELTTSDVAGHPPAWLAGSVFLSIRTCFVSVDSNLASPRFELTTSDVAGHPPAWLADSVFLSIRTWLRQDSN
jgi:hypothetical protein